MHGNLIPRVRGKQEYKDAFEMVWKYYPFIGGMKDDELLPSEMRNVWCMVLIEYVIETKHLQASGACCIFFVSKKLKLALKSQTNLNALGLIYNEPCILYR